MKLRQNVRKSIEVKPSSGAPVRSNTPLKPATGADVSVLVMIAYESKQERRGTQDDKIGKHKTTARND